jgi:nucleoside-diphosphate-sugar epimerase
LLDTIRRKKFAFIGSRDNLIPMVHVSDLVQAMLLAAEKPMANGRIYHIADGERTSIGQMMDYLAELIDCEPPRTVLPYFVPSLACSVFGLLRRLHLCSGPGPVDRVALRFLGTSRFMEIGRAQEELGYAPKVGFREGMAATVRWIEKQADDKSNVAQSSA